jgi:VanZ family protein
MYFCVLFVLWASLIFYFSHRQASQSSVDAKIFIETFETAQKSINELDKDINLHFSSIYVVRKMAHVMLYTVLTYLGFNIWFKTEKVLWKPLLMASLFSILFAISDEIHQSFIPGRTALISDVRIDSYGIAIGGLLTYITYSLIGISKRRLIIKRGIEIVISMVLLLPIILLNLIGCSKIDLYDLYSVIIGKRYFVGINGVINHIYDDEYALYEDFEAICRWLFELLNEILYNNQEVKGTDG